MKRELIPYYISRAILAALLGVFIATTGQRWWMGPLMGLLVFAGFIWYAHSGFYAIDPTTPLAPLRRDEWGKTVRDRAVVIGVGVGGVLYAALSLAGSLFQTTIAAGHLALAAGAITYFVATNWLFIRGAKDQPAPLTHDER